TPERVGHIAAAALGIAQRAPLAEELAGRVEVLDAVVPRVSDVHVAVGRNGDAPRFLELSVAVARAAPGRGNRSVRIEHADPRCFAFDNVEAPVAAECDILRIGQGWLTAGALAV